MQARSLALTAVDYQTQCHQGLAASVGHAFGVAVAAQVTLVCVTIRTVLADVLLIGADIGTVVPDITAVSPDVRLVARDIGLLVGARTLLGVLLPQSVLIVTQVPRDPAGCPAHQCGCPPDHAAHSSRSLVTS